MSYTMVAWGSLDGVDDDSIAADLQAQLTARGIDDALIRFMPGLALYPSTGPSGDLKQDMAEVVASHEGLELMYLVSRASSTAGGWLADTFGDLSAAQKWMNSGDGTTYPQLWERADTAAPADGP